VHNRQHHLISKRYQFGPQVGNSMLQLYVMMLSHLSTHHRFVFVLFIFPRAIANEKNRVERAEKNKFQPLLSWTMRSLVNSSHSSHLCALLLNQLELYTSDDHRSGCVPSNIMNEDFAIGDFQHFSRTYFVDGI
jgi:hypothetical protein